VLGHPGRARPLHRGGPAARYPHAGDDSRTADALGRLVTAAPPQRSWLAVRWRQFRHAPRPVVRAVGSSLAVATVLGLAYLAHDVALTRGTTLPGGDLRLLALALDIVL